MLWLTNNPFTGIFQAPLLPEEDNDLGRLYFTVDGFKQAAPEIDKWAIAVGQLRTKPAVALIFGPTGSGCSSAARYVAYRCTAAAKGNATRNVAHDLLKHCFVEFIVADEHQTAPTAKVVSKFFKLVTDQRIETGLEDRFYSLFGKGSPNVDPLSLFYTELRTKTKAPIKVPIFCLERVRNYKQISAAIEVFGTDAVLICTTTIEAVAKGFTRGIRDAFFSPLQFNLTGLAPGDVVTLYEQRWEKFAKEPNGLLPIEKTTIEQTFIYNWPIRGVVIVLDDLLSAHAEAWESAPLESRKPMTAEEVFKRMVHLVTKRREEITG
jgi:hypothetical protein